MSLSWTSVITLLDKLADKGVTDLPKASAWINEALIVVDSLPTGVVQTSAEVALNAILPVITLVETDLKPIAASLDAAVASAVALTGTQAATLIATIVTAIQNDVKTAGSTLTTAVAAEVSAIEGKH
jgi:hypothetical protein